jgi:threonine dehydratase
MAVDLPAIQAAARRLAGQVVHTPCMHSRTLSAISGVQVWVKFENHQFTASFKDRGAGHRLMTLTEAQRAAGVLAVSAGNHAQGVAYHAGRLGIRAVIVMPQLAPAVKVARTRELGAEVVLHGEDFDSARQFGLQLATEQGLTVVHPYDDADVICGQGTVALEMLADVPELDVLLVPVGGGGLISGVATAAKALRPGIRVVGVQSSSYPAVHCLLAGTTPAFKPNSIAEGIAVKSPGQLNLDIIRAQVDSVLLVDEGEIEEAILMLLEIEKTLAEGAGAAPLAALLRYAAQFRGQNVGLVLSGGNIDPLVLADIIKRGMVRSGRLARLLVEVPDLPGALAKVSAQLALMNANIEEVQHQRAFTRLPAKGVEIDFVIQTRSFAHLAEVVAGLTGAGFPARAHGVYDGTVPAQA